MEYDLSIRQARHLVDAVLDEIGAPGIDENPLFVLNKQRNFSDHVEYSLAAKGAVRLDLTFSSGGLEVGMNDMAEVFEWSDRAVRDDRNRIAETLKTIFCSTIEIKRYGKSYRKLRFLDNDGKCVQMFSYVSGISFSFGCKVELFRPLLPEKGK